MAWIEIHQSVASHKKTLALADHLDIPEYAAVGLMTCFWLWAIDSVEDGRFTIPPRQIARAIRWDGDATKLIDSMVAAGFLERDGDELVIVNWWEYIGKLIEQRRANAERQKQHREKKKAAPANNNNVTGNESNHNTNSNSDVTVTSPPRNTATVPDTTLPDRTEPDQTDRQDLGGRDTPSESNTAEVRPSSVLPSESLGEQTSPPPRKRDGGAGKELESLLAECDATPGREHYRAALEKVGVGGKDEFGKQIHSLVSYRLRVLQNWCNGDGVPDAPSKPATYAPVHKSDAQLKIPVLYDRDGPPPPRPGEARLRQMPGGEA